MTTTERKAWNAEYNKGWSASRRGGVCRAWESGTSSDAFDCGYLDYAAGRDKWHLRDCPDHDHCGQG